MEEMPDAYIASGKLKRWDTYTGQEHIIIDNLVYSPDFDELVHIMDSTPHNVRTSEGYRPLLAKKIIITSLYSPTAAYMYQKDGLTEYTLSWPQFEQIRSRLTSIQQFCKNGEIRPKHWVYSSDLILDPKEGLACEASREKDE
jgi:hypothetical protein